MTTVMIKDVRLVAEYPAPRALYGFHRSFRSLGQPIVKC